MKRVILFVLIGVVALGAIGFLGAQLVPYGRDHTNPPVTGEPTWDSPATQELAQRACYDCHSNETIWPWYANVAPVSWLVQRDVDEGRQKLNFSRWDQGGGEEAEEMGEVITNGSMPPRVFLITHPEARLTNAEKELLAQGLIRTVAQSPGGGESERGESGEHGEAGEYESD